VPQPGNPQALNRYSYVLNNPLKYTDPSGHDPWLDWIIGFGYQFANNMAWGLPNQILGTSWQEEQSYAFHEGQQVGQAVSQGVGVALAVDGAIKAGAGVALMPATGGTALVAAVPSGGTSLVVGGSAIVIEGEVVVAGVAEAAYGTGVFFASAANQPKPPRYTKHNFRRNLENRTPKPQGMQNPEAHHMLPQEFADRFGEHGVNVHDPRWGAWVEGGGGHQSWSKSYNAAWKAWLDTHAGANIDDIIVQAQRMAAEYGINWSWQP